MINYFSLAKNLQFSQFATPKIDIHGEPSFLENVHLFMKRASDKTKIPKDVYKYMESCSSVIRFNIPLKLDNGRIKTIPCYRA